MIMTKIQPVITPPELATKVYTLVQEEHLSYVEAIIHICDELDIDPTDMGKLVTGSLKDKVEAEAQRNNILPKPNSLFDD
jgi:hypothetical protein